MSDSFNPALSLPLVSIAIPNYNSSGFVIETLESVKQQTYKNIELVIVDDCSTDDSYEKISHWIKHSGLTQVNFIKNERNLGLVKTCNILLRNLKGKYYSILGCDDVLMPDKIERQVTFFETASPDTALIYSNVKTINEEGHALDDSYFDRIGCEKPFEGDVFISLLHSNFIPAVSVILRTDLVKKAGGYDESLAIEDWDLWLRLSQKYKIGFLNDFTAYYRVRAKSVIHDPLNFYMLNDNYITMFKKYIGTDNDKLVYDQIEAKSVYAYYRHDPKATQKLGWILKRNFNFKLLVYYMLAILHLHLPLRHSIEQ